MVDIYISEDNMLVKSNEIKNGVWVNMVNPTEDEINYVSDKLSLDIDFIKSALDEEERSRIDTDEDTGHVLIVVDIPYIGLELDSKVYETIPLGIILTDLCIVTV